MKLIEIEEKNQAVTKQYQLKSEEINLTKFFFAINS